jgi:hypothetical protein
MGVRQPLSRLIMAVAQRIDLNHYAVLDANLFHEQVGAEIVGPRLDIKISSRLARDTASSVSISDQAIDPPVPRYLRGLATIFKQISAGTSLFNQLAATPYGFGEQQ